MNSKRRPPCGICGGEIETQDFHDLGLIRFRLPLCKNCFTQARKGAIPQAQFALASEQYEASVGLGPKAAKKEEAAKVLRAKAEIQEERQRIVETGRFFA